MAEGRSNAAIAQPHGDHRAEPSQKHTALDLHQAGPPALRRRQPAGSSPSSPYWAHNQLARPESRRPPVPVRPVIAAAILLQIAAKRGARWPSSAGPHTRTRHGPRQAFPSRSSRAGAAACDRSRPRCDGRRRRSTAPTPADHTDGSKPPARARRPPWLLRIRNGRRQRRRLRPSGPVARHADQRSVDSDRQLRSQSSSSC